MVADQFPVVSYIKDLFFSTAIHLVFFNLSAFDQENACWHGTLPENHIPFKEFLVTLMRKQIRIIFFGKNTKRRLCGKVPPVDWENSGQAHGFKGTHLKKLINISFCVDLLR